VIGSWRISIGNNAGGDGKRTCGASVPMAKINPLSLRRVAGGVRDFGADTR
jgi:hypothetical protein